MPSACMCPARPAWLTAGDPTSTGLAGQYRRALAHGIPEAEDDRRYGDDLAAACMSWALIRLQRLALLDARSPGDPSRLQLNATLEATALPAAIHEALPHLTAWIRRIAGALRHRWPDANQGLADSERFTPYLSRH